MIEIERVFGFESNFGKVSVIDIKIGCPRKSLINNFSM